MPDLGQHIGAVARRIYGEPNQKISSQDELRFGNNGSLSVDLKNGRWFDHEAQEGGNVVALIKRGAGVDNDGVGAWLRNNLGLQEEVHANGPDVIRKEIEATYDYQDEHGELLFQTMRYRLLNPDGEPVVKNGKAGKVFSQRRPDGNGGWVWSLKNTRIVPYRLPELLEAIALDRPIFIVEGEKKVERLLELGCCATCNPMGAGKWCDSFASIFWGANIILLPDNDDTGRKHADSVGSSLNGAAASVKLLELPGLPDKGDIVDWTDNGGTIDELYSLAGRALPWGAKPPELHFGAVWFREAEAKLCEPAWLVHNLLTCGDKSLVYGPSQSGKSFLATHIALSIARGEDLFGRKVHRGGVVYIAAEGKKGFKKRLQAYKQGFGIEVQAALPFLLIPAAIDLYAANADIKTLLDDFRHIIPIMHSMGVNIDLVVIDTLAGVSPGANENASEDMSRIIKHCEQIQDATNGHVMIVHHKNAAGDRPRGHTSLYAAVDNAIEVMSDDFKNRTAKIVKLKDAEDGENIGFRLKAVTVGHDEESQPITSCVVIPALAGSIVPRNKKQTFTPEAKVALQALRFALDEYGEPAPGTLQLPISVRVVQYRYWLDRFTKISFEGEDDNQQVVKRALQRAGTQLLSRNIIGRNQPYVWLMQEQELH